VVVIAGLKDRCDGEKGGGKAKSEEGMFHKVWMVIVRNQTDARMSYSRVRVYPALAKASRLCR
jgi:hypothetical protein